MQIINEVDIEMLAQTFKDIKNNITACIDDLEHTSQVQPNLIVRMKNTMKDIERAKETISAMKHVNCKHPES